jgi:ParB family chromosome partitioning protein
MAAKHIGLGRGLGALIRDSAPETTPPDGGTTRLPILHIRKSPWQPRRTFAPEALDELVRSIKERGVLQPLLVRRLPGDEGKSDGVQEYELIAGERRLRAAELAKVAEVPAIVMDATDAEALELALIENLQREDLNIVEEAEGYAMLLDKFSLTQEEVAQRVGKARASVANCLRLLSLPDNIKRLLSEGALSPGHAKVLLGLEIPAEQELLAQRCIREGLAVRALERLVARLKRPPKKRRAERSDIPAEHVKYLANRLQQHLGTSVRVQPCRTLSNGKKAKGSLEIDFFSSDELDRLLILLGLSEDL